MAAMDGTTLRVREAERRFLRRGWWIFPAAGLVAAMLTGGGFWAWVSGNRPWLDWRQLLTARAAVLALAGLAVPAVWRILLKRKWPGWAVALAVAAGFACAEAAVRIPAAQTAFWLAARSRGYLPEVCYVRLDEAAGRNDDGPGILLAGSSQMIFGVDETLLRELLSPTPVVRRAIAGMWPQSMLAMWGRFPFRRGDVCVQIRSAFDFLGKPEFDADWFRPVASMAGAGGVLRTAGAGIVARHAGKTVDFLLAASLEGWRMRDGMRALAMQWMREPGRDGGTAVSRGKRPAWESETWDEWQWRAFAEGARRMKSAGVSFQVFEGDVNPSLRDEAWKGKRREWLARMEAGEREGLWHLVGLEEQDAGLAPGEWVDATHVNAVGREKLTRAMGRILARCGGAE
jgi:hypothetical protein